jgi:hypothetical protein
VNATNARNLRIVRPGGPGPVEAPPPRLRTAWTAEELMTENFPPVRWAVPGLIKWVLLLELEAPNPLAHPELSQALEYYAQAHNRYGEGEWRLAVESVRQTLAALVGKKADEEDSESDVENAIKTAYKQAHATKLGYERQRELVRQAMKFMADLGAHPEAGETRRVDAYAALMIAGGLLHAFTRATSS